jgi:hypothetical protein
MFKGFSQSSSGAETIVGNRLRELECMDPVGRRAWSRDCKENRRGKMDGTSRFWRLLGLSGSVAGRRTLTVSGGLREATREETLPRRGLVSTTLGLNSFLTRPPNRLTLPRKVRLLTEAFAVANGCSWRSTFEPRFVVSSTGGSG